MSAFLEEIRTVPGSDVGTPLILCCGSMKDGSRFIGVVDTFSEDAGNYEVFLTRASQVQDDGTLLPIQGPGVLLTKENSIVRVEFWDPLTGPEGSEGDRRMQDARGTS